MVDIEHLQFGLETFGDIVANEDASLQTAAASIRQIVREGKLAIPQRGTRHPVYPRSSYKA